MKFWKELSGLMISHSKHLMNSSDATIHSEQFLLEKSEGCQTYKKLVSLNSYRTQAEVLQSRSKIWIYNWYNQTINTRHDSFQWSYSHVWENSFYFCLEMPQISPLKLLYSWDPLSPRHLPKGRPPAHQLHRLLSSLTHLSSATKYMHQDVKSAEPSKHFCWNRRADNL